MTRVFLSWSGDLSRKLAEELRSWLPGVLQFVKPYFTPEDIEKGAKWNSEITKELEESDVGMLCLTRNNLDKPWIIFEAGALSKNFGKSKVCTVLFGIDTSDLSGPLTGFQDTKFTKKDFKCLIETINGHGGDQKLEPKVLDSVFEMWWPQLEEKVSTILKKHPDEEGAPTRSDRELLEEILELSRMSASRPPRRSKMSHHAILELLDAIEEVFYVIGKYGDKNQFMLHDRLRRPVKLLALEIDSPELYERFMHIYRRMKELRRPIEDAEQENPEDA